jgi:hypothetical protein
MASCKVGGKNTKEEAMGLGLDHIHLPRVDMLIDSELRADLKQCLKPALGSTSMQSNQSKPCHS